MPRKPVDQLNAGRAFWARMMPSLDVEHFAPLWHLFTVGHLVATDLDRMARRFGCSFADLDFLGTLAIDERRAHRATDLASTLHVSNAVTSTRIARLEKAGLVERSRSETDQRAFDVAPTPKGKAVAEEAIAYIAQNAQIVRFFRELDTDDQKDLVRLLGHLHQRFDREFAGTPYTDD